MMILQKFLFKFKVRKIHLEFWCFHFCIFVVNFFVVARFRGFISSGLFLIRRWSRTFFLSQIWNCFFCRLILCLDVVAAAFSSWLSTFFQVFSSFFNFFHIRRCFSDFNLNSSLSFVGVASTFLSQNLQSCKLTFRLENIYNINKSYHSVF